MTHHNQTKELITWSGYHIILNNHPIIYQSKIHGVDREFTVLM
jgi:hypothetical protein